MPAVPAPRLILASASPRRRHLLRCAGVPFRVQASRVSEHPVPGEPPRSRALRLAREKARDVAARARRPTWVLGADTLVVVAGRILEKPADDREARSMLRRLAGRRHTVISGVCLTPSGLDGAREMSGWRATRVTFAPLGRAQLDWILAADEHHDKAGAYAVQGRAGLSIRAVSGSPSNVIGLPLDLVSELLGRAGFLPAPVSRSSSPRTAGTGRR
jgi:septum formation protein